MTVAPAERTLPKNLDAERSILGAVIVTFGKAMDAIADQVREGHFYSVAHQRLYRAMVALYTRGDVIDFVTLKEELARTKQLADVGGPSYVAGLCDGLPGAVNVPYYVRIVREKAAQREIIYAANDLLASAYDEQMDPAALIDQAERALLDVSAASVPGDLVSAAQMVDAIYPVIEQLHQQRRPVTGLSSGFPELDRYTRGLQPGDLIILGGRPSQGKTTLAAQIALQAAAGEATVAFFSVEMSQRAQMFRILSTLGDVDGHRLQCGQLDMIEQQRVADAMTAFRDYRFWLDEAATVTALQIRSRSRRLKARVGLGLIVVDYLQLLQHPRMHSREEAVAATGRLLKALGRELNVPVIALCQLNRAVEQRVDKRPNLSDLRESGSLEQDADLVLLIHRPPPKDEGAGIAIIPPTELIIAKQRNGPTTTLEYRWLRESYRFQEIPA